MPTTFHEQAPSFQGLIGTGVVHLSGALHAPTQGLSAEILKGISQTKEGVVFRTASAPEEMIACFITGSYPVPSSGLIPPDESGGVWPGFWSARAPDLTPGALGALAAFFPLRQRDMLARYRYI